MKNKQPVCELDLRDPKFPRNTSPDEYEFRDDGEIVRKDRWENGIRKIAAHLGIQNNFEIDDVAFRVYKLVSENNNLIQQLQLFKSNQPE